MKLSFDLEDLRDLDDRALVEHIYNVIREARLIDEYDGQMIADAESLKAAITEFCGFYFNADLELNTIDFIEFLKKFSEDWKTLFQKKKDVKI